MSKNICTFFKIIDIIITLLQKKVQVILHFTMKQVYRDELVFR